MSAAPVQTPSRSSRSDAKACRECGRPEFEWARERGDFCCDACRRDWNNRRQARGAVLYDLVMALRFDRKASQEIKLWTIVCKFCAIWRDDDVARRASRPSWREAALVVEERPWVFAASLKAGRRAADKARRP